ncbi:hypothetical protein A5633_23030 [Mycolicibacterium elephantis]|uniref:hypothetical protein n=1 Tax=Mycolicibacterium elephantis TaxID=81858 RepID=UPI0007EB1D3E|nr:hypothetical protein [Mycolicibacterium elephantis]OBA71681.1 hypothetical protein A5633_23030 [Mycolicibacterium elephantis]
MQESLTVTADPPRQLTRGQHFDLASAAAAALQEKIPQEHRSSLLRRFGFDVDEQYDSTWLDDLLRGAEPDLVELAEYLGLANPIQPQTAPAEVDAYAELVSAETALRDVVRAAIPNWTADLDAAAVTELDRKRAEEDKRRDGIAVSQDLLDYTEIYALQKIISKRWDPEVKAVLDDRKRTDTYLGIILDIRNAIGHSRPVFPAERLLLAGAAGQIRNQLARYRAKADGPQRHYPSLDSARDSMGNVAPSSPDFSPPYNRVGPPPPPTPRLEVGDVIVFHLEGTDPRGRDLIWRAHSIPSSSSTSYPEHYPLIGEATGDRVEITWKISENDVGEWRQVAIVLTNSSRYHRHRDTYDDGCVFSYHVNPPPDA